LFSPVSRALLLFSVLCLVGCSGKGGAKTTVTGKITFNNQPVSGSVHFVGPGGKEVQGALLDGAYKVDDAEVGENKIAVKGIPGAAAPTVAPPKDAPKLPDMGAGAKTGVAPPKKYESPENGLKYTVAPGKQTKDFELQ